MTELGHLVESYTFVDVVRLWGRERLVHEVLIARELARGVVDEGLRLQSVNPKHVKSTEVLRGEPLVGFAADGKLSPVLLRAEAFEHLQQVMLEVVDPSFDQLRYESVHKTDFLSWLVRTGRAMPAFWFSPNERYAAVDA